MSEADLQSTTGGQSESAESQEANQVIQELEKRITDAFLVFDTSDNRQVDVRELGTVMRSVNGGQTELPIAHLYSVNSQI